MHKEDRRWLEGTGNTKPSATWAKKRGKKQLKDEVDSRNSKLQTYRNKSASEIQLIDWPVQEPSHQHLESLAQQLSNSQRQMGICFPRLLEDDSKPTRTAWKSQRQGNVMEANIANRKEAERKLITQTGHTKLRTLNKANPKSVWQSIGSAFEMTVRTVDEALTLPMEWLNTWSKCTKSKECYEVKE